MVTKLGPCTFRSYFQNFRQVFPSLSYMGTPATSMLFRDGDERSKFSHPKKSSK